MVVEMALSRGSFTFRATSARCLEAFRAFDFAVWKNPRDLFSSSRSSEARFSCTCISAMSGFSPAIPFARVSMVFARSSIFATRHSFVRSVISVVRSFFRI